MKILFTILLVLNFLTEALASTTLIGGPDGIAAAGRGGQWSMHYGFAALAIASISLWAWPYRSQLQVTTVVLGVAVATYVIEVSLVVVTMIGPQNSRALEMKSRILGPMFGIASRKEWWVIRLWQMHGEPS